MYHGSRHRQTHASYDVVLSQGVECLFRAAVVSLVGFVVLLGAMLDAWFTYFVALLSTAQRV
jgi:hypothetical protein